MRKGFQLLLAAACVLSPLALGHAQEAAPEKAQPAAQTTGTTGPAQPEAKSAPAKAGAPSGSRSDAAEARYRAWVDKEHAQDAAVFQKEKSKIEDKYKGYVRPKRDKKTGKADKAEQPVK